MRAIRYALVRTGHGLLLLALLLGPLGPGGVLTPSGDEACETDYPCEEADAAEHGSDGHAEEAPCEEECPETCLECGCCSGLSVGILTRILPLPTGDLESLGPRSPPEDPATGVWPGVFRPPRALI